MSSSKPTPLYPTYAELCEFELNDYPSINNLLTSTDNETWWSSHWSWGKSFLEYTGRNKSVHTYDRFRNEIERFLLWAFLEKKLPIDTLRKSDIFVGSHQ